MRTAGSLLAVLGLLGLLERLPVAVFDSFRLDLATVLWVAAGFYFIVVEWRLGLAVLAASIILYMTGAALPVVADAALLVAGVVLRQEHFLRAARAGVASGETAGAMRGSDR